MSKQQTDPIEWIVRNESISLHDDNIYHIMTFLKPEFIIGTCMMVSKQWNEQARIVPIKLLLKHTLPSVHFNLIHLEWTNKNQSMKCVQWILTCPSNLTALSFCDGSENGIGDEGCQLLDCSFMRNLTSLNLNKQSIGNRGCKIIANSSHLTNLRTLALPSNTFDNEGLKELVEGSIMVNLTSLDLSYSENCTNEGFQSLITSPYITNLKSLNLAESKVKELVFSKPLFNLEELNLGGNVMTNITVNYNLCNLTRLDLSCNELTDTTCELYSSYKLTDLNLAFTPIGDRTLGSIAYLSLYPKLTRLEISPPGDHEISPTIVFGIVDNLTMLTDLSVNFITMAWLDCMMIAECSCFRNMTRLSLEDCDIGSEGVRYITSNKSELKYLNLEGNGIGDLGCHYIATSPFMIHLETLNLTCNTIYSKGCQSLVTSPFLPRLLSLTLGLTTRRGIEMLKYHHFDENCEIDVDEANYSSDEEFDWYAEIEY